MKVIYRDCPVCGKPESIGVELLFDIYVGTDYPAITVQDCKCTTTPEQEATILDEFASWDIDDWLDDYDLNSMDAMADWQERQAA